MNQQDQQEEMFCIDDLMSELQIYVREELQNCGKTEIEAKAAQYSENETCWLQADREHLRQILVRLLDNAVKYIDRGFILFGYFVMDTDVVDFFVDDTRTENYNENLTEISELVEQMGCRLKTELPNSLKSSYKFTVRAKTELVKSSGSIF